jgi:hypothetical protein
MRALLLAVALAGGVIGPAAAQVSPGEGSPDTTFDRISPFGEVGTYQLEPVYNYLSVYGLTDRHDIQTTSGAGSIDLEGGAISLESGTGTDDNALLQSVRPGIYAAGRTGEAGQGIVPITLPAANSTAYMRWGAYNIDSGANVELHLIGRRYDVTGKDERDNRTAGSVRTGIDLADGTLAATVCVRRKDVYPAGTGRENTVSAFAQRVDVITDAKTTYFVAAVDSVSGGTWGTPASTPNDETGLEFNTGVTSFGSIRYSSGPFPATSSKQGNAPQLTTAEAALIPLRGSEPLCVLARGEGANPSATDVYFTVLERQ